MLNKFAYLYKFKKPKYKNHIFLRAEHFSVCREIPQFLWE